MFQRQVSTTEGDGICETCSTHGGYEKCVKNSKSEGERQFGKRRRRWKQNIKCTSGCGLHALVSG